MGCRPADGDCVRTTGTNWKQSLEKKNAVVTQLALLPFSRRTTERRDARGAEERPGSWVTERRSRMMLRSAPPFT